MEQAGEQLRDSLDDLVAAAAAREPLPVPLSSLEERAAALVPLLSREWSEDELGIMRKFLIDVCIAQRVELISWLMMHVNFNSLLLLFQSLKGEHVLELLKYCSHERLVAIYTQYLFVDFELAGQMLRRYRDVIMALWPAEAVQAGAQNAAAQLAPPQLRAPGILW
jgi:hypothetical protein